jgi:hypothetical protein
MSRRSKRLRAPALLIAALAALLVFAAAASAEVWTGESTTLVPIHLPPTLPEGTLVKASVSYDTSSGSDEFTITTAGPPMAEKGGKPSETFVLAELVSDPAGCKDPALIGGANITPAAILVSKYSNPTSGEGFFYESASVFPVAMPTVKTLSGATTTLSATSSEIENQSFNCAVVSLVEETTGSFMIFPITALPAPPAPPSAPAPSPAPTPAPAPGPPVLSIAGPKPLKLKVGKAKTVKIKVSNTGATATAPGSLKVKAPTGVLVRPGKQQVPSLVPGGSFTLSVRVETTEKAKKKSTLSVTGTASGLTAKTSLVIKLTE